MLENQPEWRSRSQGGDQEPRVMGVRCFESFPKGVESSGPGQGWGGGQVTQRE